MATPMPAIFFGHGNPMNALLHNGYTEAWSAIGVALPARPRAVVMVSAHWYVEDARVTEMAAPDTIHDFGGFPRELSEFLYPAPGDPVLAERLAKRLPATLDDGWGLDHGTWSVLCHVFPNAEIPIVQLSVDRTQPSAAHYALGKRLATLRDEGILVAASGNVIHNLRAYAWGQEQVEPYDWALRFEAHLREAIVAGDHKSVVEYAKFGRDAELSAPTPDHFLPLLYILGAQREGDAVTFPVEGIDGGSISMLSVRVG